jgi:hypothetical protein
VYFVFFVNLCSKTQIKKKKVKSKSVLWSRSRKKSHNFGVRFSPCGLLFSRVGTEAASKVYPEPKLRKNYVAAQC